MFHIFYYVYRLSSTEYKIEKVWRAAATKNDPNDESEGLET